MTRQRLNDTRPTLAALKAEMRGLENPERAQHSLRFFKTGKGDYAEGDRFLGLTVPQQRQLARSYAGLSLADLKSLLQSPWHEHRLTALLIMVRQYVKSDAPTRTALHQAYLAAVAANQINNWNLVDTSAETMVGAHFFVANPAGLGSFSNQGRRLLLRMAASPHLWTRRVAMLATFHAIKQGAGHEAIPLAEALVNDPHDLMHKAVGWMLREMGKRNPAGHALLCTFLDAHAATMPRTALRYALEKFEAREKAKYMGLAGAGLTNKAKQKKPVKKTPRKKKRLSR